MEKLTRQTMFCSFFSLVLLLSVTCPSTCQEVENEIEFSYKRGSENGPERWGEIHPEWSLCSNGTMQSPIDLSNERVEIVSYLGRLKRDYKPSNATLINRGHDIMVRREQKAISYVLGIVPSLMQAPFQSNFPVSIVVVQLVILFLGTIAHSLI
ncbi:unnamed protein product [Ilex paraguariensis]|uniref:Alpha-carbonic anhydrase domain-containing protein n=1 Tax=Ilex paraguariensis TaxID=185542 RepID=A0ABC8R9K4_9AQUA